MEEKFINKRDLIESVAVECDLTITQASNAVEFVFDHIKQSIDRGDKVSIGGFGIFRRKVRIGRNCRNPRTGEAVVVGDINVVKFSPATAFKELIK